MWDFDGMFDAVDGQVLIALAAPLPIAEMPRWLAKRTASLGGAG